MYSEECVDWEWGNYYRLVLLRSLSNLLTETDTVFTRLQVRLGTNSSFTAYAFIVVEHSVSLFTIRVSFKEEVDLEGAF
jgi:hypothetical protein